jgi:hypothetical protein
MRSRVAAALVVLHLLFVIYALAQAPLLTKERWQDFNLSGDAAPIAGREFGAADQPQSLTVLIVLDFPAAMGLFIVNFFTAFLFSSHLETWSWVNAGFMFIFTLVQWWLVGFALERSIRFLLRQRNRQHAIEQIVGREPR